ncbi:hypothetical protein ANOM_009689 [Aspergillus nomiae NRRL 13137]|uniref:Uncharacterized protein n=1 Tax=Aspergillus nomiae NRRL (strain ATCC 15546 / NRRL 13137 / CBS 260.88 / M93) TaxID=1509407 RepID=A0A0L1ISR4_ASPN3|nr:uncharacterized protein ANOM_009689 [Aspergillus nomiae NRRL 13137]KNG82514.1 hypothetical protein ANOM_009689 [Aspergillus nomiae NRRL 13137]
MTQENQRLYRQLPGSTHPALSLFDQRTYSTIRPFGTVEMVKYIFQFGLRNGTTLAQYYEVKEHITKLGGEVIDDEEPEDDDEVPPEINIWWDDEDDAYELTEHENCGRFSSEQKREAEEEELRKAAWGDDYHNQTVERSS